MKKVLFALSALVILATSCKKDKDDDAQVTPTTQNLAGTYKVTKIEMQVTGQPAVDMTSQFNSQLEPCQKDNVHKLNADLTYQWVDAGTKCDPDESYSDTWSLTNSTTIVVDDATYTIKSFNGSTLVLSEDMGGAATIYTYVKQ